MRLCAIVSLLMLLLPAQVMAIVFEEDFVQGQSYETGTPVGDRWNAFTSEVGTGATQGRYQFVKLSGSNDPDGYTCTDPTTVNQLGVALSTGAVTSVVCDGNTWNIGSCGSGPEINVNGSSICTCELGYTLRPTINAGNPNWGGINSQTCSAPSQTIRLEFGEGAVSSIPTISEWGMILMSLILAGSAFWMIRRQQVS